MHFGISLRNTPGYSFWYGRRLRGLLRRIWYVQPSSTCTCMDMNVNVFGQGIAVNSEMMYSVATSKDHPEEGAFVFASDRQPYLQGILDEMGIDTVHCQIRGNELQYARLLPMLTTKCRLRSSRRIIPPHLLPPQALLPLPPHPRLLTRHTRLRHRPRPLRPRPRARRLPRLPHPRSPEHK